ncbi:MAG: hypothetical protein Q8P37_00385, partial [Candidatus Spechtbacteria bacterium]|nr:hypothetical protein [Candidatus Spechtbacteria bacterium]
VATGILFSENTFSLNDPDRDYATKLSTYGDTHTSIRKITPTNTDFSTIFISISPPLDFVFMDEQGRRTGFDPVTQEVVQEIPGALYSFLAPLTDDNKTGATNGDGATQLDFNLPAEGEYMLQIHEPEETEEYNLAFYVLGKDADAVFVEDSNTATPDFGQTYSINYFPGEPFPAKVDLIVDIDIKPESATNPINCSNSNGIIPLAILSDDGFDATTIDPNTVRFGPLGVEEFHRNKDGSARQHLEDVDNDGDLDLVLHFTLGGSGLTCEDVVVGLSGTTFTGLGISGSDNVRMIEGGWFFLSSVLNWINHWALFR